MRDVARFRVPAMVLLALGLFAGGFSAASAQATPGSGEPGTLVISKFVCTQIEEPTATVSDPVDAGAAADQPAPEEGCVPDAAAFQIFVNSDFTSNPIDIFVNGTATVNGVPSTAATGVPNALFDPVHNVYFEFEVTPSGVTRITVLNPAKDEDGATLVADATDDGAVDSVADDGGTPEESVAGEQDEADEVAGEDDGDVSGLPSTGQGSDGGANGSAIVLLFGAMSMVALAAGFAWRQRRSA